MVDLRSVFHLIVLLKAGGRQAKKKAALQAAGVLWSSKSQTFLAPLLENSPPALLHPRILGIGSPLRGAGEDFGEYAPKVEPRFFTLEEVAIYLNVSVPQVYSLVRSGDLPAVKIGGRGVWRVNRKRLEEYIERLHAETAKWAKSHPLNAKDEIE